RDRLPEPGTYALVAEPEPQAGAGDRSPATGRCPKCGQRVLPRQSRCLQCNTRLHEEIVTAPAVATVPVQEPVAAGGVCPGCHRPLADDAVLCIECGYDLRVGKRRQMRRMARVVEREELPRTLELVKLGLGFYHARIVVFLLITLISLA